MFTSIHSEVSTARGGNAFLVVFSNNRAVGV